MQFIVHWQLSFVWFFFLLFFLSMMDRHFSFSTTDVHCPFFQWWTNIIFSLMDGYLYCHFSVTNRPLNDGHTLFVFNDRHTCLLSIFNDGSILCSYNDGHTSSWQKYTDLFHWQIYFFQRWAYIVLFQSFFDRRNILTYYSDIHCPFSVMDIYCHFSVMDIHVCRSSSFNNGHVLSFFNDRHI